MDIQELPAIRGTKKREYTISVIHRRTRMKYAAIHTTASSTRVAEVLRRAVKRLAPCFLVVTDTAMVCTLAYTAHPERTTTFERTLEAVGLRHYRIKRRSPWQNGIIERSNRTDHEECFHQEEFICAEHRRYRHRRWEMYYNTERPHQGRDGASPLTMFQSEYPFHAAGMGALTS